MSVVYSIRDGRSKNEISTWPRYDLWKQKTLGYEGTCCWVFVDYPVYHHFSWIISFIHIQYRVKCRYSAVNDNMILHMVRQWLRSICIRGHIHKTPHISPSRASYGVSIEMMWEKIYHVITAPPYCIYKLRPCSQEILIIISKLILRVVYTAHKTR